MGRRRSENKNAFRISLNLKMLDSCHSYSAAQGSLLPLYDPRVFGIKLITTFFAPNSVSLRLAYWTMRRIFGEKNAIGTKNRAQCEEVLKFM